MLMRENVNVSHLCLFIFRELRKYLFALLIYFPILKHLSFSANKFAVYLRINLVINQRPIAGLLNLKLNTKKKKNFSPPQSTCEDWKTE